MAKSKPKELKLFFIVPLRDSSLIKDATLRVESLRVHPKQSEPLPGLGREDADKTPIA